jgi:AraC-like DNA-binding protein
LQFTLQLQYKTKNSSQLRSTGFIMAIAPQQKNPITLSRDDYWAWIQENVTDKQTEATADQSDFSWHYPAQWGQGFVREICLREGVTLAIGDYYLHHHLIVTGVDREHPIELGYTLAGNTLSDLISVQAGQHVLCGSGMAPGEARHHPANQRIVDLSIHIEPALLCQWCNGTSDPLPPELSHLVKPLDQPYYTQTSITTVTMQTVIQQILQCPFQGLTQRMYLESKVWELMALELAQTPELDCSDDRSKPLKPEDIERIHYAKDLLVSRLSDPPSLIELARLVGINDCKLKAGFRQVFGTTVFGYLHSCRMERSRQLLGAGEISVAEAAQSVGFVNRSHFAIAFRKQFGVNPSIYRRIRSR